MPSPKIKDVQVIATAPEGLRLAVVKIITDQAGLYGYGCATFTQRARAVETAIRRVVASGWFVLGPEVEAFENIEEGLGAHVGAEDLSPTLFEFTVSDFAQECKGAKLQQFITQARGIVR